MSKNLIDLIKENGGSIIVCDTAMSLPLRFFKNGTRIDDDTYSKIRNLMNAGELIRTNERYAEVGAEVDSRKIYGREYILKLEL